MFDMSNFISPKQMQAMKREVVKDTLSLAFPIIALRYENGIMMMGSNPSHSLHKTSEIYDRIAFAGTGVFNDYERLRKSGVHLADVKGFQYSRKDVKAKSIASEYSTVLGDIFVRQHMPMEVEILIVEIGEISEDDRLYFIPFSGGLVEEKDVAVIGDFAKDENGIREGLLRRFIEEQEVSSDISLSDAARLCAEAISSIRNRGQLLPENIELVALDRTIEGERKFVRYTRDEIAGLLSQG